MASTKQTTQSWKQLNTTAAHKSHRRREKPHSPPSTCSINPCYQKSPSPRANCTPASWPSSQPKTAKLVTSSSDPAQCGHHTLGRVYPVANMSVIYCTYSRGGGGGGGYSLCDGWYICAAVLTPFFHFGRIEHDLFGVFFLIHQHQNDLLGY